ncbi:MAG: hypothetical protein AB7H96_15975 [Vicinamibacterales bacterium]
MPKVYVLLLGASVVVAGSCFLPWFTIGEVGLAGVPDPAALFVFAVGLVALALSAMGLLRRGETRAWILLAGLAALTTLTVVSIVGPTTVADRAQARAEALSIVDNVPMEPVPPVRAGIGLMAGLAGAVVLAAVSLAGVWRTDTTEPRTP